MIKTLFWTCNKVDVAFSQYHRARLSILRNLCFVVLNQSEAGCREAATCGAPGWKRVREPSYTPTQK